MKGFVLLVVIIIAFVLASVATELFHGAISSALWHWRHGNAVTLLDYRITIPRSWFVDDVSSTTIQLGRAHVSSLRHPQSESRVILSVSRTPLPSLESWMTQEHAFYGKQGARILRTQEIPIASQYRVICFEGQLTHDVLKMRNSNLISAQCESNDRLSFSFTGTENDLNEFYSVVEKIRRLD